MVEDVLLDSNLRSTVPSLSLVVVLSSMFNGSDGRATFIVIVPRHKGRVDSRGQERSSSSVFAVLLGPCFEHLLHGHGLILFRYANTGSFALDTKSRTYLLLYYKIKLSLGFLSNPATCVLLRANRAKKEPLGRSQAPNDCLTKV